MDLLRLDRAAARADRLYRERAHRLWAMMEAHPSWSLHEAPARQQHLIVRAGEVRQRRRRRLFTALERAACEKALGVVVFRLDAGRAAVVRVVEGAAPDTPSAEVLVWGDYVEVVTASGA